MICFFACEALGGLVPCRRRVFLGWLLARRFLGCLLVVLGFSWCVAFAALVCLCALGRWLFLGLALVPFLDLLVVY